jgi:hypothetical protein
VACREVFDEAGKDECFAREARRYIVEHPGAWFALVPKKLAATFNYSGAAGSYLHESNPDACGQRCKRALGMGEIVYERLTLFLALIWAGMGGFTQGFAKNRDGGTLARVRLCVAAAGLVSLFFVHAWVGYLAFALAALLRGRALSRDSMLGTAASLVVLSTALTHAVFFGGGRYSLVVFPLLSGVSALAIPWGARCVTKLPQGQDPR